MIDAKDDVSLESLVNLVEWTITRNVSNDSDLVFVCLRPGVNAAALQEVSDINANAATVTPPRQKLLSSFPIGTPVRVAGQFSDPNIQLEGTISHTFEDGTIHIQPDDMSVGQTIVVASAHHDDVKIIIGERKAQLKAARLANEEARTASRRRSPLRRAGTRTLRVIKAIFNGMGLTRYVREPKRWKSCYELRYARGEPISFHDPQYITNSKSVRTWKMNEGDFSIPVGLRFAEGGEDAALRYTSSSIYNMRNAGDEAEANSPFIDEDAVHIGGYTYNVFGRVNVDLHGNKYCVRPNNSSVGNCTRPCCNGMIECEEVFDEHTDEVTYRHRITAGHSLRCQVRSLVENKADLQLTNEQVESVLLWFIQVEIGIIVHPRYVSNCTSRFWLTT